PAKNGVRHPFPENRCQTPFFEKKLVSDTFFLEIRVRHHFSDGTEVIHGTRTTRRIDRRPQGAIRSSLEVSLTIARSESASRRSTASSRIRTSGRTPSARRR